MAELGCYPDKHRALAALVVLLSAGVLFAQNPPPPAPSAQQFLSRTEAFVRPPKLEELMSVGLELNARGQTDAAKSVFGSISSTAADAERLTRQLLQLGQYDAAGFVITDWQRRFPNSPAPRLYHAILYLATGNAELTLRELRLISQTPSEQERPLVELLNALAPMIARGVVPSEEANPWGVRFISDDGSYQAGRWTEAEKKKLPAGAFDALVHLLLIAPKQPNLWALLGELYNAHGDPDAAIECFRRAEILQYNPRTLRDHRRVLLAYQKESARASEDAMSTAIAKKQETSNLAPSELKESRTGIYLVLSIGALFALFVIILQIREWTK